MLVDDGVYVAPQHHNPDYNIDGTDNDSYQRHHAENAWRVVGYMQRNYESDTNQNEC
jgi:hypothetical protein